jgi:hypothetical protein
MSKTNASTYFEYGPEGSNSSFIDILEMLSTRDARSQESQLIGPSRQSASIGKKNFPSQGNRFLQNF